MPNMDDVLRQNPDLARQMAGAAASAAGPGFGNFMNMAMGGGAGAQAAAAQPQPQQPAPGAPTGGFFGSSQMPQPMAAVEPRATARKDMRGPSAAHVDDILRAFEEVRQNDTGIPLQMGATTSQPAVMAAVEMQSMGSDDIGSTTESTRTGGGRRRRKVAVGNTLSLNV
jgi:hypothetical protein